MAEPPGSASSSSAIYVRPTLPVSSADMPNITSPRLLLRQLRRSDLPAYHRLRASTAVMLYSPTHLPDIDEAVTWVKLAPFVRDSGNDAGLAPVMGEGCMFGIELGRLDGGGGGGVWEGLDGLVGDVGVTDFEFVSAGNEQNVGRWEGEVGYMIDERLWGKGMASEALAAFVKFWWQLEVEQVTAEGNVDKKSTAKEASDRHFAVDDVLTAITEEENVGSYRVLVKCGFREEKRFIAHHNGDRLIKMVLHRPKI